MDRRNFLRLGGGSALGAAALVACSGHGTSPAPTTTTSSTALPDTSEDVRILRTASSLEHYLVGIYMEVAGLNLIKTAAALDMVKFFADHHSQHAGAIEGATARLGGQPFTQANPVLSRGAAARIAALHSEADGLRFVHELETMALATYVAATGSLVERSMDATVMGVASTEARHITLLGVMVDGSAPYTASAVVGPDGGLAVGTGV